MMPGMAECDVIEGVDDGAGNITMQPTGEKRKIYNWASIVVCDQVDRYGVADLHIDLLWWVSAEECEAQDDGEPPAPV